MLALLGLMGVGAVVRWMGARNELWLDEILSLNTVRKLGSPWEVFTRIHWDNNHYLNSLYLYFVRGETDSVVLRGFSIVCGVLTILAAWWLGSQVGRRVRWVFAGMVACSYPLIHFSSEARGYGGAVLGMVLACAAACTWMRERGWWMGIVYGVAVGFGVLSHLTAVLVWGPLAVGSLVYVLMGKGKVRGVLGWVGMNLIPAGVMGWLWWVDLREVQALGGPAMGLGHGMARLMALSFGWRGCGGGRVCILVVGWGMVVVWQVWVWVREGNWLGLGVGLVAVMPVVCMVVVTPTFFSPRYFLVVVPFVYLAVAAWGVRVMSGRGVWVGVVLMGLFVVGEGVLYGEFLRVGRGHVGAGLRFIAESTPGPFLNVASSQDFRAQVELMYYRGVTGNRPVSYVRHGDEGFFVPDWYIVQGAGYDAEGAERIEPGGARWERVGYFGASELSGQAWTVYRRVGG